MKKRIIGLVAALTPLIACTSAESTTQASVAQRLTTADVPQAIAQSDVMWVGSGFYFLNWVRSSDQSKMYGSAVYIEASNNYRINVYKTVEQDPFGSVGLCGGLGCGLEQGELAGSLQLRPVSNTEFVVDSATGSAAFLEGASCNTRMTVDVMLTCNSVTGPAGDFPSIIRFEPGT